MRLLVAACLLLAACGKVGDPLPPFIRIPEPIKDLAATQSGHSLVLTWTNPARNIDGSAATDLARVQIRSNGTTVAALQVIAAGKPQSHLIPLGTGLGTERTFTAVVETLGDKISDISNTASITPVEVPGPVTRLSATVDQRRIVVHWEKPPEHPELADAYLVTRTDTPEMPHVVTDTTYQDDQYEPGKVFTYHVTPLRKISDLTISGVGPEIISVTVQDKTPPRVPSGLDVVQSDTGIFLTWNANEETDFASYRVFRSDRPDSGFVSIADGVMNSSYFDRSGKPGIYYAVSAVDEFSNESAQSAPFRVQ